MLLSATATFDKAEKLSALGYGAIDVGLTGVIYHDDPLPHYALLDAEDYTTAPDAQIAKCKELGLQIRTTHLPYRFDYTAPTAENYEHCYAMTVRAPRASGDRRRGLRQRRTGGLYGLAVNAYNRLVHCLHEAVFLTRLRRFGRVAASARDFHPP